MWLWAFVGFCIVTTVKSNAPECPPREDISPCSCYEDGLLTSIDCRSLNGLEKLKHVVKNTQGLNMSFAFWKSNLGDIPSDIFQGHQSVNLHFENCQITSFGNRPFTGLENSLKRLYIYGSVNKKRLGDLKTFPLGHLKKLDYVAFLANDIKRLGNDWFADGPESLTYLDLQANDIEELGDKAFASLVNLEHIWLGDNRYKTVSRSMFPKPARKLKQLEISFGGIEVLPEDMFEDMPALSRVLVSGNKLVTIPESTWGSIWNQLEEVYFERNQGFTCDDRIKWIYERNLPRILSGNCPSSSDKLSRKKLEDISLEDFN